MKFRCLNCQNKWEEYIEKGRRAEENLMGVCVISDIGEEFYRRLVCPRCETSKKVIKDL
jgi:DNA-directed RNA polymerase subunit RPC12/RpoP